MILLVPLPYKALPSPRAMWPFSPLEFCFHLIERFPHFLLQTGLETWFCPNYRIPQYLEQYLPPIVQSLSRV